MTGSTASGTTHYDTLGVSRTADPNEIKKAFRELSLKYHPDMKKDTSCGEQFKRISNAHSILSNPVERKSYDRRLIEDQMWRKGMEYTGNNSSGTYGKNFRQDMRGGRRRPSGGHMVMETLTNPRYFVLGLAGLGSAALFASLLGGLTSKRQLPASYYHGNADLVEAWKNPRTGRYEQPVPWDKEYQRLQPKLEKVPREKVWKRQM